MSLEDKNRINAKMTAAIAAVLSYIQTEEEAVAVSMTAAPSAPARAERPAPPMKLWGVSGRQEIMSLRGMMQLKAFHGGRTR